MKGEQLSSLWGRTGETRHQGGKGWFSVKCRDGQRRLAICNVKLSMYICSVAFPDDNFSVSLSTVLTRSSSTADNRR